MNKAFKINTSNLKLISSPDSNWHIYYNPVNGWFFSIAVKEGCESSFYGKIDHIKKLIHSGHWNQEIEAFSEYGRELLSGVYSPSFVKLPKK